VALSTGAACSSGIEAPSHVLRAIGLPAELMEGALRIGVGKFTSDEEVLAAAEAICQAVEGVRAAVNS
jgi:cysteine desulfurase